MSKAQTVQQMAAGGMGSYKSGGKGGGGKGRGNGPGKHPNGHQKPWPGGKPKAPGSTKNGPTGGYGA